MISISPFCYYLVIPGSACPASKASALGMPRNLCQRREILNRVQDDAWRHLLRKSRTRTALPSERAI